MNINETTYNPMKNIFPLFLSALLCSPPAWAQNSTPNNAPTDSTHMRSIISLGSVDEVTQDRMNKGLVTNSLSALSGKAAGVNIASNGSDRMAMLSSVRVRGTTSLTGGNDPLVIIDGVNADLATLSSIYPADIESFAILKNAAETAPYGSRGASGVIQVTTKKGHSGNFHITYDGNVAVENAYKNIEMLRRNDYIATAQKLGAFYNDGGFDTDFPDAITRTGFVHNHHVAFSGGTEKSNYRASIGYMNHDLIIRYREARNFVTKIDLKQKAFNDFLTVDMGVFGSSQKNKGIFDEQKLFYSAASHNPTFPDGMNSQGGWDKNSGASQIANPIALLYEQEHEKALNINTHLRLTFDISADWKFILFGSFAYSSVENMEYLPTWVWAQGQAYRGERKSEDRLGNATLTYNHTWGNHRLKAVVLGEYQSSQRQGFFTTVKGFTTNEFGYHNLGAGSIRPYGGTGSDYEDPRLASAMAGVEYGFKDMLTLAVNTRADGSSMVGKNNRWGFFPSISATWDVLKMLKATPHLLTMLKMRTGYGLSGNLGGISSYNSLSMLMPTGIVAWNGSPIVTMGFVRNANPDLKWESKTSFNIGADMGLWMNRLVLTAEYYYTKTRDMLYLYDVSVPPFAYEKLLANMGQMSNQGLEIGLGLTPIQHRDMELNVNVNLSFQKNKLISLSGQHNGQQMTASDITAIGGLDGAGFHSGNNNIVYQIVGQPLGVFFLPHCTGLKQNDDGSYSYQLADLNNDGQINIEAGDRRICGQATPKMTLGSNISLRYKNFDISLQMNGAFGHKIYNGTSLTYMNMASFPDYNVLRKAPQRNIKDQMPTDYWLEKGDYLNFDYLTLAWNVPLGKTHYLSALRLSLSINNLATITSYSGLTPMINSYVVNSTMGIDDKRSYPPCRTYSIGLGIQF